MVARRVNVDFPEWMLQALDEEAPQGERRNLFLPGEHLKVLGGHLEVSPTHLLGGQGVPFCGRDPPFSWCDPPFTGSGHPSLDRKYPARGAIRTYFWVRLVGAPGNRVDRSSYTVAADPRFTFLATFTLL